MGFLQLLLYQDLPEGFLATYGRFICKRKRLHNGWQAVRIRNGFTFMLHAQYDDFAVPAVKKIREIGDGKMIFKTHSGAKVIYNVEGKPLTPFNHQSILYPNGWYQCVKDGVLSLYDATCTCVGTELRHAKVYKNGMYHMSVLPNGDERYAGIFSSNGEKLLSTNATKVAILPNGWFVVKNTLYNNLGKVFLEPIPMRKVPFWLLCLVGRMMKQEQL